jgi:hypothetical protein
MISSLLQHGSSACRATCRATSCTRSTCRLPRFSSPTARRRRGWVRWVAAAPPTVPTSHCTVCLVLRCSSRPRLPTLRLRLSSPRAPRLCGFQEVSLGISLTPLSPLSFLLSLIRSFFHSLSFPHSILPLPLPRALTYSPSLNGWLIGLLTRTWDIRILTVTANQPKGSWAWAPLTRHVPKLIKLSGR